MRKLRLRMEELEVETFSVSEDEERKGTVHGAERSMFCNTDEVANCSDYTCAPPSCPAESCGDCGSYMCTWECPVSNLYVDGACV